MIRIQKIDERIVFKNYVQALPNTAFNVIVAGETYPDSAYYIKRDESDIKYIDLLYEGGMFVLEYVKTGTGYIESGNKKFTVRAGDFYLLNTASPHIYYADKNDPFGKHFINFSGPLAYGLIRSLRITEGVRIYHKDISAEFAEIESLLTRTDICRAEAFDRIAVIITGIILNLKPEATSAPADRFAAGIRQYINENCTRNIDLDSICARFYISKSFLISLFKREYNITPHQYIIDCRIEKAKKLLENESDSISVVAARLGFDSAKYFYSVFKRITRQTPGEYREKILKEKQ